MLDFVIVGDDGSGLAAVHSVNLSVELRAKITAEVFAVLDKRAASALDALPAAEVTVRAHLETLFPADDDADFEAEFERKLREQIENAQPAPVNAGTPRVWGTSD